MSQDRALQRRELSQNGYTLLKGALSPAFMSDYRKVLGETLYRKRKADESTVAGAEPDSLGRFPDTRILLEQQALFETVADILEFAPGYCHHSDIQINRTASWHRDSINKGLYFDFCKTEIFDTSDYAVYKICVYCQDHQGGVGLSVIPGTHLKDGPPDAARGVPINSRLGDVILFDTRLYHKGIVSLRDRDSDSDRMSCFMTLARDNPITREFVNGTIWRQNQQLNRDAYSLPTDLAELLTRVSLPPIPYENSPQPSMRSVFSELEGARKRVKQLERENSRLKKHSGWLGPLHRAVASYRKAVGTKG